MRFELIVDFLFELVIVDIEVCDLERSRFLLLEYRNTFIDYDRCILIEDCERQRLDCLAGS